MELISVLLIAAVTFGVCFLVDKGFTKAFRGKPQHRSGLSVRLNKRYGAVGLIVAFLGIAAVVTGPGTSWLLFGCGWVLIALGAALVVYYMTFGIFYDEDSFILTTFGKKSVIYQYGDIQSQQLYNSYGNVLIELHMRDGRAVQLQAGMEGVYPFLDKAFLGWLRQNGKRQEDCPFHDPSNSCWFPPMEA